MRLVALAAKSSALSGGSRLSSQSAIMANRAISQ